MEPAQIEDLVGTITGAGRGIDRSYADVLARGIKERGGSTPNSGGRTVVGQHR